MKSWIASARRRPGGDEVCVEPGPATDPVGVGSEAVKVSGSEVGGETIHEGTERIFERNLASILGTQPHRVGRRLDHAISAEHRALVAAAGAVDVAYDLLVRPQHLPAATALVDAFPTVRFVIDHIGKPPRQGAGAAFHEVRRAWERGMRALAERPNVACKLSGLLTEGDWRTWSAQEVEPLLEIVVAAFGAGRCLMGTDWPVCTLAASYATNVALVTDFTKRLSSAEQRAITEGAARTWYRLGEREDRR